MNELTKFMKDCASNVVSTIDINDIVKSSNKISDFIHNLIKDIDFEKIDKDYEQFMIKILKCGFYPTKFMGRITLSEIVLNNEEEFVIKTLSSMIIDNMINYKSEAIKLFPNYLDIFEEVFKLYSDENYRLCILSLIQIISLIFNETFIGVDPFSKHVTPQKLKSINFMGDFEKRYMLFIPLIDNDSNLLSKTFQDKPDNYLKYNYNRNAILHGYVNNFDTKINCLRWFSVLFNTIDLINEWKNLSAN